MMSQNEEVKQSASLGEMPWHVKQAIAGYVPMSTRLTLRKVAKDFVDEVDRVPVWFKKISFSIERDSIHLRICDGDVKDIHYYLPSHLNMNEKTKDVRVVVFENHMEMAINDLAIILKSSRARIECLTVDFAHDSNIHAQDVFLDKFQTAFGQREKKLEVSQVEINFKLTEDQASQFLGLFRPETLTRLEMHLAEGSGMTKLMEMKHWKHIKVLRLENAALVPLASLFHLTGVSVTGCSATMDELEAILKLMETHRNNGNLDAAITLNSLVYDRLSYKRFLNRQGGVDAGVGFKATVLNVVFPHPKAQICVDLFQENIVFRIRQ